MAGDLVETGVDRLLALLRQRHKIALDEAAKILKTPEKVVQAWVDFLVEERILGLEYKFTKPYIYLSTERPQASQQEEIKPDITLFTREYLEKAADSKIPPEKAKELWNKRLSERLQAKKEYFMQEARKHGLEGDQLWPKYQDYLLSI